MITQSAKFPNVCWKFLLSTLVSIRRFLKDLKRKPAHLLIFAAKTDHRRDFNGRARTKPLILILIGIDRRQRLRAETRIGTALQL